MLTSLALALSGELLRTEFVQHPDRFTKLPLFMRSLQ